MSAKNIRARATCSQGTWESTLDVTRFHRDPDVNFEVNHKSSYGLSAMKDEVLIANAFSCPSNFISVPAMEDYTTHSFCVAKYEMKEKPSGKVVSNPNRTPYTGLNRDEALVKCTEMGEGYDLITNDQWQSIARNIEQVPHNWGEGLVGSEQGLNQGHSDNSPHQLLEASYDNRESCIGTGQTCSALIWHGQRRVHRLSNEQMIWDFSGNATEWVKDLNNYVYGSNAYMSEVTSQTHTSSNPLSRGTTSLSRQAKNQFGPSGHYQFSLSKHGGFGYGVLDSNNGAIVRGGDFPKVVSAGVFRTSLAHGRKERIDTLGFRCVFHSGRPAPIISIDSEHIEIVDSSNVSNYPLSGSCSDEGGAVYATIGSVEETAICSGGSWRTSFDVTGLSHVGGFLQNYLSIQARHASTDGRSSPPVVDRVQNKFNCPKNYIGVPALSDYTTHGFCLAKYEMKEVDGKIVSQPEGLPKINLTQEKALKACEKLGGAYDLVTNDEWQTVVRNIEMVSSNWKDNYPGGGAINRGHMNTKPNQALPASTDDNDACYLLNDIESCTAKEWNARKRTHTLASGEVIWDLAGNLWEWVRDGNDFDYPADFGGNDPYVSQITRINHSTARSLKWGLTTIPRVAKDQFGPADVYALLRESPFGGFGRTWITLSEGAVARGGSYNENASNHVGLFAVTLRWKRKSYAHFIGFRCVYRK